MMKLDRDRLWASNGFEQFRPRSRVFRPSRLSLVIYLLACLGATELLWAIARLIEELLWNR
jgi:hypothetical protein